jgi:hypothetical protein
MHARASTPAESISLSLSKSDIVHSCAVNGIIFFASLILGSANSRHNFYTMSDLRRLLGFPVAYVSIKHFCASKCLRVSGASDGTTLRLEQWLE